MIEMKNVKPNSFGIYQYRKVVPEPLRPIIGKREFVASLRTKNKKEAVFKALLIEKDIDAQIEKARAQLNEANFGAEMRKLINGENKAGADAIKASLPQLSANAVIAVSRLRSKTQTNERTMSLTKMLQTFLEDMRNSSNKYESTQIRYEKYRETLIKNLINNFDGVDKNITDVVRSDIRNYINARKKQIRASSLKTEISTLQAMFKHGLREIESSKPNPFEGFKVNDDIAPKDRKRSFNSDEAAKILKSINSMEQSDLKSIALLISHTGCRLNEIVGLDYADVELNAEIPYMHIRPNNHRGLKRKTSKRILPIPTDLIGLFEEGKSGLVFAKYAAYKNSAEKVGKELNTGILRSMSKVYDAKASWHSWRHTMEDGLKNSKCEQTLINEILGHAQSGMSGVYGDGFDLKNKKEAMEKAISYIFK